MLLLWYWQALAVSRQGRNDFPEADSVLKASPREYERKLISDALVKAGGDRTHAARALGIAYRWLRHSSLDICAGCSRRGAGGPVRVAINLRVAPQASGKEGVMATAEPHVTSPALPASPTAELSQLYQEGIIAGIIGAGTIAIWFLILDAINGRPLYTPTVLGTALFKGGEGLASPESLAVNLDMVLMFTWVHGLVFIIIGGVASRLLGLAEHNPNIGFGILLLFVGFEFGFVAVNMAFAEAVLRVLAWQAVLVGNLLAAAAMSGYFWQRHPNLTVSP